MGSNTTLLITMEDCSSIVPLTLWLNQFPELEVATKTNTSDLLSHIEEYKPDVLILKVEYPGPEDLRMMRNIRAFSHPPAILLSLPESNGVYDTILANEADGIIKGHTSLKEIIDSVRKVANKRKLTQSTANIPMTKAG